MLTAEVKQSPAETALAKSLKDANAKMGPIGDSSGAEILTVSGNYPAIRAEFQVVAEAGQFAFLSGGKHGEPTSLVISSPTLVDTLKNLRADDQPAVQQVAVASAEINVNRKTR
jgi:hypothetical protein